MVSKAKADELGITPLGEVVGYGQVAGPDPSLLTQPSRAINSSIVIDRSRAAANSIANGNPSSRLHTSRSVSSSTTSTAAPAA